MKRVLLCWLAIGGLLAGLSLADSPPEPAPPAAAPAASQTPAAAGPAGTSPAEPSPDEAAIRTMARQYVEEFNKHDAKTLADFWSPEAVYLNRATGEQVVGRDAIAEQFTAIFKDEPEVKMTAETESVRFISPNVAIERGDSTVTTPKSEPEEVPYSAVYVKRDGKWLLDRVTDEPIEESQSHYEQLKPLEWMVGRWVDKDEHLDIETECKWTKNRNFLTRAFSVSVDGNPQMSGMQIVGWDANAKTIRSWTFDSNGGFAEAKWTHKDDRWYIHSHGVLGDGRKASMVNVIKPIDASSFTWQTIERTAGGEMLPNVPEVLIVRQQE